MPADQLGQVREKAIKYAEARQNNNIYASEYADTAKNATDRLRYGGAESTPLTKAESIDIVKNPEVYAKTAFEKELVGTTKIGAIAGGTVCGALSVVTNGKAYADGKISGGQAVANVIVDTGVGTVKGATISASSVVVKETMSKGALASLAKTTAPIAIATTALDVIQGVGSEISKYSRGEIDGEEAVCNAVGHTAKAMTRGATAWAGAAAFSWLGPLGTLGGGIGGGIAGYLFGDSLFS